MTKCHIGSTAHKLQNARKVIRAQEALLEWYRNKNKNQHVRRELEKTIAALEEPRRRIS